MLRTPQTEAATATPLGSVTPGIRAEDHPPMAAEETEAETQAAIVDLGVGTPTMSPTATAGYPARRRQKR